jgi:AcrR family transcriptional regulator
MKFTPRSEATRNFIIEASAEVFNKKGFAGTSITDLEKATGLSKGSIYGNFENKDAVALAVLEYNLKKKKELIRERVALCTTYKDRLRTYILVHYTTSKIPFTPGGCPMQNTAIEADDTNEELRGCAAKALKQWIQDLTQIVEKGIEAKEFKPGTDPMTVALHIISLIEGAAFIGRAIREGGYGKKLLDMGLELIDGIVV